MLSRGKSWSLSKALRNYKIPSLLNRDLFRSYCHNYNYDFVSMHRRRYVFYFSENALSKYGCCYDNYFMEFLMSVNTDDASTMSKDAENMSRNAEKGIFDDSMVVSITCGPWVNESALPLIDFLNCIDRNSAIQLCLAICGTELQAQIQEAIRKDLNNGRLRCLDTLQSSSMNSIVRSIAKYSDIHKLPLPQALKKDLESRYSRYPFIELLGGDYINAQAILNEASADPAAPTQQHQRSS